MLGRILFLFVLAPIGAAVWVAMLLLLGVKPHYVFAPGFFVKSLLHAPNAAGVIVTVGIWWAIFAALGLLWERHREQRDRR